MTAITPRVLNKKQLRTTVADSVYIGRPSAWGNPFVIGKDGSRNEVIAQFERWIEQQPRLMARLKELKSKHLICWCSPLACHGDVLLQLANRKVCE